MRKKISPKTTKKKINLQEKKAATKKQKVLSNKGLRAEIVQRDQKPLEERLRFEMLLAETSSRFINLPADQIDSEIKDAQRRICEFLKLDRSSLGQIAEQEPESLLLTHIHHQVATPFPERLNADDFFPWTKQKVLSGETVIITNMSELPPEAGRDRESYSKFGSKSVVIAPLSVGGGPIFGLLTFSVMREEREWPDTVVMGFRLIAEVFANALARKRADEQLKKYLREIEELKKRLEKENIYLKDEAKLQCFHEEIIGESEVLKKILAQAKRVAQTESSVLIVGETGTGKELIARAIHCQSKRSNLVMVKVDCASLPSALIESELFGREKGAYTGALAKQIGRFELADGSTIFLDEIGDLPLELQTKLLRVLQNGEFERLGSPKTIHINVRVIAATNRNLEEAVKKGIFREDLYYRLKVFPIQVPPLREHREDIPLLVHAFLTEFSGKMGKKIRKVPESTMKMLKQYQWPGNVRELRNIIEQAVIITDGDELQVNLPQGISGSASEVDTLEKAERQHIIRALEKTMWRIKGRNGAAELLGLKPSTLYAKMEKLGIPTNREKGRHIDPKTL
jgi:formate hydrogenlyase transcriptional activator